MLEELRKLEAAATPGPWDYANFPPGAQVRRSGSSISVRVGTGSVYAEGETYPTVYKPRVTDALLIAAMRNALPLLLDVVEAAEWWVRNTPVDTLTNEEMREIVRGKLDALARLQVQLPHAQGAEQRPETEAGA